MHVPGIAATRDKYPDVNLPSLPGQRKDRGERRFRSLQGLPARRFAYEFQRYFLVSAVAFGVDICILVLLKESFALHYLNAAALSFSSGLVIAYVFSIRWVFRYRCQTDWRREFLLFASIGLCGLMLNEGVMWAVTDGLACHYSSSKLIAAGCVFLFNFCLRKTLLFSPKES